jgi:glycosyltransferase involved in cell wall biosynthesis
MKNVWIINQHNMPPAYGHLNRHYYFGQYLKQMGYEPSVFVGSFLHNTHHQMIEDKRLFLKYEPCSFDYTFVSTCDYSNSKFKRLYAMLQFYTKMFKVSKTLPKPDVVIGSSPHLLSALAAILIAKKYNAQSIVEVRDLWPESLKEYGVLKNPLILGILYSLEKWIYKKADKLIFTMDGGAEYIKDKGWDKDHGGPIDLAKVFNCNNGVDLATFNYNRDNYKYDDADLENQDLFRVIYTGSIRHVNNIQSIVKVAQIIQNLKVDKVKFLIYGEGNERHKLETYCQEHQINNISFKGFVDKQYIPYILSQSHLNIFHFEPNKLAKYGASLNKMFEYFASGKPTLTDCMFKNDLIIQYHCGLVVDHASDQELADTILYFANMPLDEYNTYGKNALRLAKQFDYQTLTAKLIDIIEQTTI